MSTHPDGPPSLSLLATLTSPSTHGTRTWQTRPHLSPTKPLLATASSDKSVHVWSLKDFRLLSTISGGHKRSVRCVDWKDYGGPSKWRKSGKTTLATGSFDANVGIWEHNPPHSQTNTNAMGGDDEMMHDGDGPDDLETNLTKSAEDEEEWNFTTLLTGPDSEIKSIAFSPPHYSANLLATSSRDKSVWVWEEVGDEEWETIAVCQEHTGDVKCVAWCEGGRFPKRRKVEVEAEAAEEEMVVGSREILASGSYDDTIRLWKDVEEEGDWMCVGVIEGHEGTVWDLCWEKYINTSLYSGQSDEQIAAAWEPRILSCSDDLGVRVWRRELSESEKEKKRNQQANGLEERGPARLPSIIRPPSNFEKWTLETKLPEVHVRSVYTVDWSKHSGLVVSCGGDGTIAVYQEMPVSSSSSSSSSKRQTPRGEDVVMNGTADTAEAPAPAPAPAPEHDRPASQWMVVATMEAAHNEYEINHVCWAKRLDRERRFDDEEIIVSTGDDGDVKIWTLPEEVLKSLPER